jgi:hypothetical protein
MIDRPFETPRETPEESIDSSFLTESEVISYKDDLPGAVRKVGDIVAKHGYEKVSVIVEPPDSVKVFYPSY